MQNELNLFRKESSRVTYAAVFVPSADNPDQDIKYLLPQGIRGAAGFEQYDKAKHHRDTGLGILCCGNCYEQSKGEHLVPVHHRKATDPRIAGGDLEGTHATFSAFPHTIDTHDEECKKRRTKSGHTEQNLGVKFHINMPSTYRGPAAPHTAYKSVGEHAVEGTDARLSGRRPEVIHESLQEILKPISRLSRDQVQDAMYVVDGQITPHTKMLVDGDAWKRLVAGVNNHAYNDGLFKIFHVTKTSALPLRDFASAAAGLPTPETKISCQQYEFVDMKGKRHIIQPAIITNNDEVRARFEKSGDFLVISDSRHVPFKTGGKNGVTIHQISCFVEDASQIAELYQDPMRKIADYNAFHNMQLPMVDVHVVEPKKRAMPMLRVKPVSPGQVSLFATADMADAGMSPH